MTFKPFDLTGKVALISGGNRGIGLGMAMALAQAGSDIVIWGTDEARNRTAEAALRETGVRVLAQRVDLRDEAAVAAGMSDAVASMGRLDTFVANAGVGRRGTPFLELGAEAFADTMAVNLQGAFWSLREACRAMVARAEAGDPGGSIIALSSIAAIQGVSRNQAYSASKGALIPLIRSIAIEHARHGVRANVILPGWIATDRTAWLRATPEAEEKVIGRVPLRRWGRPEDFAGIAVYLASDASAYHTGDSFVIDGGYTIF